jgi:RNA polymerase sigma-70 factor (ECF subfamily)
MDRPDHNTSGADDPVFTALWNAHRRRMLDLAFRMLLDLRDAEDVVQEAFARLARTDIAGIDDPEGWLVVVTGRLCLDKLRARQRRPTDALDVVDDRFDRHAVDPSTQVTLVDNVTLAMHALLERLSPAERTSFVLHDVFQYSFEDVATIVGRSPAACRQLASRARRTLQAESATGRFPVDSALQRQVSERFIEACTDGDLKGLLALLDPAVDGAGDLAPEVVVGAANVAPGILRYLGPPGSPTLLHLPVGDRIGIVALRDRRVLALVLLTIDNGLVVHVDALAGAGPRAAVSAALGLR